MDLLKLASAKLPPDQTPSLLKDMEAVKDQIILPAGAIPSVNIPAELRALYSLALDSLYAVKDQLSAQLTYDPVLVDADFDAAGYGIFEILAGKERVATGRQIALTDKLKQRLEDTKLVRRLFDLENAKGREIFSLPYQAEYNAIEIVISRADGVDAKESIERLGLVGDFERLAECHEVLRRLLGIGEIKSPQASQKTAFARFEETIKQLIFAVGLYSNQDNDEHRKVRELLLGPYEKHVATYRERQRKATEPSAKKNETLPTPGTSSD